MATGILNDQKQKKCCLYCTTTNSVFGPVFDEDENLEGFIEWLKPTDPRELSFTELTTKRFEWAEIKDEATCEKDPSKICECNNGVCDKINTIFIEDTVIRDYA